jgi:probable HAF family extracellular repeat protein
MSLRSRNVRHGNRAKLLEDNVGHMQSISCAPSLRTLCMAVLLALSGCILTDRYEVIDLSRYKSPDGYSLELPMSINNLGEIVGDGQGRGIRWRDGVVQQLGLLRERPDPRGIMRPYSGAKAINDRGTVVGHSYDADGGRAVVWESGQPIREIEIAQGGDFINARAISNSGLIGGSYKPALPNVSNVAFLWRDGVLTDLGTLGVGVAGKAGSYAQSINDRGQVLISSTHPEGLRAAIWEQGRLRVLKPLEEQRGRASDTAAYTINAFGQAAGCSGKDPAYPVVWDDDGTITRLFENRSGQRNTPAGCANDINDNGVIVGAMRKNGVGRAFIWDAASGIIDLNDLVTASRAGWDRLESAIRINNRGEIIGLALTKTGDKVRFHPFLLRPQSTHFVRRPLLFGLIAAVAVIAAVAGAVVHFRRRRSKSR